MGLKDRVEGDLKEALLNRDVERTTTLRGLKAAILNEEVAKGARKEGLSDEEIEKVIAREVKKRREAINMYEASGRGDLVENEKTELGFLEAYLPKQLSESEINEKIDEVLSTLSQGNETNVGKVIGQVKMLVGNGADGMTVARLVKEKLG